MPLDATYAGLQASVGDFLNRGDLTATIPDFIRMAEAQLCRRLRVADMVVSAPLNVSSPSTPLPLDFNGMISFELPAGSGGPMRYVKPEEVRAQRQTTALYSVPGVPRVWTITGTNLETAPAPDQTYNCTMVYFARIPPLTSSVTSNWLLIKHPDLYLYGALLQSAPYLKDDDRIQSWGVLYEKAITDTIASDGRTAYGHALSPPTRGAALTPGTDPNGPATP